MFERFTDRARRVVVLAQEEARLLNHNYIGTEHLLLGLIHDGEGTAARALTALGIGLEPVRADVEDIIGLGGASPSGHIPFTPRAKGVLELSLREALQLGHNHIGTEHILLGLVREGEGVGAQVLVRRGADLSTVRATVIEMLAGAEPSDEDGVPSGSASLFRYEGIEGLDRPVTTRVTRRDPPRPGGPTRSTPALLAVVFVLVCLVAVSMPRPPTTTARWSLGLLLAGAIGAGLSGLGGLLVGTGPRRDWRAAIGPWSFAVAVGCFGLAALLLVIDTLVA